MVIKKIILHKYKRFSLTNIETLEYTPNSPMQIILGTNGSGKSQLLKQLNPLPPNMKQDFYEDGYKYIEIEHNGNIYKLKSIGNHHSFIVNEQELNPGKTKRVQTELVQEHFRLTNDIMEILLNNNRLTNMSPTERKRWLTELSHIDYTYAVSVYNKLKQRHRDIVGAITMNNDELLKLEQDKDNNIDIEKLTANKNALTELRNHILSLYIPITTEKFNTLPTIESLVNSFNNITTTNYDIKSIEESITKSKYVIDNNTTKIAELCNKIDKLEKIDNNLQLEELKKEYVVLKQELEELSKLNTFNIEPSSISITSDRFNSMLTDIVPYINNMLEIKDYFNKDLTEVTDKFETSRRDIELLANKLKYLKEELEHVAKHKTEEHKISCPKCFHNWYNGYDEKRHLELEKNYNDIRELAKQKSNSFINIKQEYEKTLEYNKYRDIIAKRISTSGSIITSILNKEFLYLEPYVMLSTLNSINTDLTNLKPYLEKHNRLQQVEKNIELATKLEENNLTNIKNTIDTIKKEVEQLTNDKNQAQQDFNKYTKLKMDYYSLQQLYDNLLKHLKFYGKQTREEVVRLRNNSLKEFNMFLEEEIDNIQNTINNSNTKITAYERYKKTIEEYKVKEKVLKNMLEALSPSEGLIAKSINSFLNVFIKEINTIINTIWSYELELLPCDITETDLDYKFKVRVNNDMVIEDISKLSSSMKEIIDLAFRIVFTKYLRMTEYPLFLDEFGHSFDNKHRVTAYNIIDKVLKIDYPQIFVVCHYESLYGSLSNCDFNVLNNTNIELGSVKNYNEYMVIK